MSDPVTDVEIEDVLSSIRRLVGDEHRAKPRTAPEPKPVDSPVKPARLVLTPSLLVSVLDPEPEAESATVSDSQEQISEVPSVVTSGPIEDEFEAEVEAEVEALAEPADDAVTQAETDFVFESSQVQDKAAAENEPEQAAWADPETTLFDASGLSSSFEKMLIGDNEQHIGEASEPHEPQGPKPLFDDVTPQTAPSDSALEQADPDQPIIDDVAEDSLEARPDQSDQSDPQDPFASDPDDAEDSESDTDPEDNMPYSTATLGAKIAALEAKIGQTQDQWEPDGELGDDYAGTRVETIEWQDHDADDLTNAHIPASQPTEPEPTPEVSDEVAVQTDSPSEVTAQAAPQPLSPDPQGDEPVDLMANDDEILDEESLRELVADIVRQELQGALGERITRNVRKLVRREIHRALTAQELD